MAIAFDAITTVDSSTGGTSFSLNHTAAGSNRLAVVVAHFMRTSDAGIAVTAATYGGSAMTERATVEYRDATRSRTYRLSIYTFVAPPTSSTEVAFTTDNQSAATAIAVMSFTGADQTTPYDAGGTAQISGSSSGTVNVTTTVADAWLVGGLHLRGGDTYLMTPGTGVTERYDVRSGTDVTTDIGAAGGHRAVTSTGTYALAFTAGASDYGVIGAIAIRPVATAQTITQTAGIGTAEAFGSGTVAPGSVSVAPSAGVATAEAFGTAAFAPGSVTLLPDGIASAEAHGTAVFAPGSVTVAPDGVGSAESIGEPSLAIVTAIAPDEIGGAEAFGTATVAPGSVGIAPDGVASAESVAQPVVTPGAATVAPSGITSDENVNGVTIGLGSVTVAPDAIASAESLGEPVVRRLKVVSQQIHSGNDTVERNDGVILAGNTLLTIDATRVYAALLFSNLPIPNAANITGATLRVYTDLYDDPNLTIRAEDNATPAALTTTNNDISGRTLTSAGATWSASNIGLGQYVQSPDFASVVQEVTSLAGWVEGSGDLLVVLVDNAAGGLLRFNAADMGSDPPELTVTFTVGATEQTITASSAPTGEAFGEATLTPGSVTVTVDNGIGTAEALGEPALVQQQFIDPAEIVSEESLGTATVTQGGPVVTVDDGAPSEEAFGEPALTASVTVVADAIATGESHGATVVTPGAVTITPDGIATGESHGGPVLSASVVVTVSGIGTAEAFGVVVVAPGAVTIVPNDIGSEESFGEPVVTAGGLVILPPSVGSEEAFGLAVFGVGAVSVSPEGIGSAEAFGSPGVGQMVAVEPVGSAESVPGPVVYGTVTIAPDGIASLESIGAAVLATMWGIYPDSVGSEEAFGSPVVVPGAVSVLPAAIGSAESVSSPFVGVAALEILPDGIGSAEAFGAAQLAVGPVTIAPEGIASAELFGLLLVLTRFLPALNVWRVPGKARVYAVPVKARVYRVER